MDIDLEKLKEIWSTKYPDSEPVAEVLRTKYGNRWVRFHSLDQGKRYPETDNERQEMLRRHNTVLKELGPDNVILVITCDWTNRPTPTASDIESHDQRNEKYWMTFRADKSETNPEYITYTHTYARTLSWEEGVLDELLSSVAQDETGGVIIAPSEFGWLYLPYDGGADVILPTQKARDELKERHEDWLSSERSGL
jgi:hypothetical protein